MNIKQSEQRIFTVVRESNVDGETYIEVYPCDNIDVAIAKVKECKKDVLSKGHFASDDLYETDCMIDENDRHYFIKDQTDDYYEDIYILESSLFVKKK